ncbi:IclR family transcriptional regulator [Paraburkholderia tropica]|uniref:IclR family transcriptional regulator n=1 Tax=Paraburkholderia tropica TaxID=92647 RepID=UPI001591556B|nr:IclR family transcriptional regulator [Paraburkholderia tropica]
MLAKNVKNPSDIGSIERAFELLRLLATAGRYGLALTQLSESSGLPHSTVHRLLQRLIRQRMVSQRESNKRYILGPLSFELGLAASQIFDLREPCRPILRRLADEIGDTVYLTVRSGYESVCEDRFEGASAIRVVTIDVGSRRPLGLGAGGLAILASLPEEELGPTIALINNRYGALANLQEKTLHSAVAACRRRGFSLIRSQVTLGTTAVGVPILDTLDNPVAAISVAAVDSRMSAARIDSLSTQLKHAANAVRDALHSFKLAL